MRSALSADSCHSTHVRLGEQEIWDIVKSKPTDQAVVDKCIAKLEKCDAIEACVVESREMVDKAWDAMDKVLPVSCFSPSPPQVLCIARCE